MIDLTAEEFLKIKELIEQLRHESNAQAVFLLERDGQQVASAGEIEQFDPHMLAGAAGPEGGLEDFSALSNEGQETLLKIKPVGAEGLLCVLWDGRSSSALVNLRVARVLPRLNELWAAAGGA